MEIKIIEEPLQLELYGFGGAAINKDYAGTAFRLSGKMWEIVKQKGLKNKGINVWVYEPNESVFAGVELEELSNEPGLERKLLVIPKYAYLKHIGPYHLIKKSGMAMQEEIKRRNLHSELPYVEIYGHWNNDETKLETELLMAIV